jgi:hypothetical protein
MKRREWIVPPGSFMGGVVSRANSSFALLIAFWYLAAALEESK